MPRKQNPKPTSYALDIYYTRKTCEEGIDLKDYMIMACDKTTTNANKFYHRLPIEEFEERLKPLLEDESFRYEILPPEFPVKPYFDLEMENLDPTEWRTKLDTFIEWMLPILNENFGVQVSKSDLIILDSCRDRKLSYHLIIQNHLFFENVLELKKFIIFLWNEIHDEAHKPVFQKLSWMYKEVESRVIFDPLPYGRYQNYRMANQAKKKTPQFKLKQTTNFPVEDTLVRLYKGIGNRKLANCENFDNQEKQGGKMGKTQKTTKNQTARIITNDYFQPEGLTLKDKENLTYDDISKLPLAKQYLYLIPNSAQNYNFYRDVCFASRGSNLEFAEFEKWARLSKKYSPADSITINDFTKFRKGGDKNTMGLPFLRKYAKLANPEYFQRPACLFDQYFNPNYEGMEIIDEYSKYVSDANDPSTKDNIFTECHVLILQAYMGVGKTTAIQRLMKREQYKRVLYLSPRIAFAKFISHEFGAEIYIDGDLSADKLVMSMESLYKIPQGCEYDCIVMDESEANLNIFTSITMAGKQIEIYEKLCILIKKSKKFIMAGAFITDKTLDFARSLETTVKVLRNHTKPQARHAVEVHREIFDKTLYDSIKSGKKNYCCWASATAMENFQGLLKGSSFENEYIKHIYDNQIIYSSKVDDAVLETLPKIEEEWKKAPLVMTTPSITVGNSYKPDTPDFHNVFMYGAPTCIVPDAFQMHMRVREVIDNKLVFCLPTDKQLQINTRKTDIQFTVLKEFDEFNDEKRQLICNLLTTLEEEYQSKNADTRSYAYINIMRSSLSTDYRETPIGLRKLMMNNLIETTLCQKYYRDMFLRFLLLCNYKVEGRVSITNDEHEQIKELNGLSVDVKTTYDEIECINGMKAEELEQKIKKKQATEIEKLQVDKYWFDYHINQELSEDEKQDYFDNYHQNSYRKFILNNSRMEMHEKHENINYLLEQFNNGTGVELTSLKNLKLYYIWTMNEYLGIKNSRLGGQEIKRENLEKLIEFLAQKRSTITKLFNLRDRSKDDNQMNFRTGLMLVNQIYKNWTDVKIAKINETTYNLKIGDTKQPPYVEKKELPTAHVIFKLDNQEIERGDEKQKLSLENTTVPIVECAELKKEENIYKTHMLEEFNTTLREMLTLFEDFNKFKAETSAWNNAEVMVVNRMLLVAC